MRTFKEYLIKYFSALAIFFMVCPGISSAQKTVQPANYPSLKNIAKMFAQNYKINNLSPQTYDNFVFIKDPSGWKVKVRIPQELEINIWSSVNGYPEYIDSLGNENVLLTGMISNLSLYEYSVYPFYGYPGWKDDVIETFGNKEAQTLSNDILYGLGRAWSLKASDILWSHSLYSDLGEVQGEEARRRDINRYMDYSEKAIAAFKSLLDRSPGYSTYVGLMDVKFSNEIIARYYELKLFGFEKEANKLLWNNDPEKLYHEFWINYARAILSMAEKNAVVFTNGDNDTYPLLWLQEVENYRRDVIIINLSLLNDPKYITLLKKARIGSMAVNTGFTEDQLIKLKDKIILFDSPDEIYQIRNFSEAQNQVVNNLAFDSDIITIKPGDYRKVFINSEGLVDTLTFHTGPEGRILSNSEFLVKSIISRQAGKRPFYFTKGMQQQYLEILGFEQIKDEGLVFKLEKPQGEILFLDGHPYCIPSLRTLSTEHDFSMPETDFFSRKIIYDFIIESNMILLFSKNTFLSPDSLNILMESFLIDYPPEKTGINYYFPFVAGQLYKSTRNPGFVISQFHSYIDILRENIISTEVRDDDPRDIEQLNYFRSVIIYLKEKSFLQLHPDLIHQLDEMEEMITKKLLEFPELSFG
jgi:hypothetical protein